MPKKFDVINLQIFVAVVVPGDLAEEKNSKNAASENSRAPYRHKARGPTAQKPFPRGRFAKQNRPRIFDTRMTSKFRPSLFDRHVSGQQKPKLKSKYEFPKLFPDQFVLLAGRAGSLQDVGASLEGSLAEFTDCSLGG